MPHVLFGKTFQYALAGLIIIDLLSLAVFFTASAFTLTFWVLSLLFFVLALWRFDYAVMVLLLELFVGAKGQMFSASVGGVTVSLRLILFLLVFSVWVVRALYRRRLRIRHTQQWPWYVAAAAIIVMGGIIGVFRGNGAGNVFYDMNAYLYLGLAGVLYDTLRDHRSIEQLLQLLAASVVFLAIKSLFLLAFFSHQYGAVPQVYHWVRNTRMYEVTALTRNFFRVFSQSQIYSLIGMFVFLGLLLFGKNDRKQQWSLRVTIFLAFTTVLLSFSRSFWVSLAVVAGVLLPWYLHRCGWGWGRLARYFGAGIGYVAVAVILVSFLANYPYVLNRPGGLHPLSLFTDRTTDVQEAALYSRFSLLRPMAEAAMDRPILGGGFGTTVTFLSQDPRVVQATGGARTTYAFEWGYLDFLVKVGIVGTAVFLGWYLNLFLTLRAALRSERDLFGRSLLCGGIFSFLALLVTHATSPYLNHPLGIGWLLILGAVGFTALQMQRDTKQQP